MMLSSGKEPKASPYSEPPHVLYGRNVLRPYEHIEISRFSFENLLYRQLLLLLNRSKMIDATIGEYLSRDSKEIY